MGEHRHNGGDRELLVRGYSGRLLISLSIAYLAIQFGRNVLSPLLPTIIEDLAITPFQAGLALTVISSTYALSMYPGGRLSDQLSRKTVIVAAALVSIGGFALLTVAFSYGPFLLGAAVLGLGAGLYWIALRALLADLFLERRGQAFGIQDSLGFIGPVLAAGGAVAVLAVATWHASFVPVIAILLVSVVLAHVWIREPYVLDRVRLDIRATGNRVFGDPKIRKLMIAYTSGIFAMQAVIGFLPLFLSAEHGFSATLASAGFAVLFTGAIITLPIAGFLGDRFAYLPVAIGGLAVSLTGLLIFVFLSHPLLALLGVLSFGLGIWAFPPVIQAYIFTRLPADSMGGDYGAFKMIYAGIGGLGPAYVGFMVGYVSYTVAFLGLIPFLVVSMAIFGRFWAG